MGKKLFDSLDESLREKLRNCKDNKELQELCKATGLSELSDDTLEAVSGGVVKAPVECGNVCYYDPRQ